MISRKDIKNYVAALASHFAPERVVLFGSYARGTPHKNSDVDMLVIMNHDKRKDVEQAVAIDIHLQRKFPLDLIVRRPSEIKKRLAMGDIFLSTILKEGVVLHERRPIPVSWRVRRSSRSYSRGKNDEALPHGNPADFATARKRLVRASRLAE